jgi:hypothetical protein
MLRLLLFILLNIGLISCDSSSKESIAKLFLQNVHSGDYEAARRMISRDLKDIGKNTELFYHDMQLIRTLMDKNGVPNTFELIDGNNRQAIKTSVLVHLGTNSTFVKEYMLFFDFMNGDPSNRLYAYRLERNIAL